MPARAMINDSLIDDSNSSQHSMKLSRAREILRAEAKALQSLILHLPACFAEAVDQICSCAGCVVVTGIGKAGIVAQKLSASLSSTGTPSHFLHASEAVHGDLGCVRSHDVVVLLSYSGETEEVIKLLPTVNGTAAATIAITGDSQCTLAQGVDIAIPIGKHSEACHLGLAPSTSTTLMIALCDALALVVSEQRSFTREQFARFHPGGSLGRKLALVSDAMRPKEECRIASQEVTVREVFVGLSRPGRRTGAIMLLDDERLVGIFTDSDLARLLEQQEDHLLDQPIRDLMTKNFHTITSTSRFEDALKIMSQFKISELPVVDDGASPARDRRHYRCCRCDQQRNQERIATPNSAH